MGNEIINTPEYWDERFSGGSWDTYDGESQSAFFAGLAISALPGWMKELLQKNTWTVTDLGCAEGAGTAAIARHFPNCRITGVDFSAAAVNTAREKYPFCDFKKGDIRAWEDRCDVVFSSNTLEHMSAPRQVMENMTRCAARHLILLLPLRDTTANPEHFSVFDEGFFPLDLAGFELTWFREIDCGIAGTPFWPGEQILLIYSAPGEIPEGRTLAELFTNQEYISLKEKWEAQRSAAAALETETGTLREQLLGAEKKLSLSEEHLRSTESELSAARAAAEDLHAQMETSRQEQDRLAAEKEQTLCALREAENTLADMENELKAREKQLSETEKSLSWNRSELEKTEKILTEKEVLLEEASGALTERTRERDELTGKLQDADRVLTCLQDRDAALAGEFRELSGHKIYRLAHFLNRLHWQLFKGSRADRRAFWKWLFGHFTGKVNDDRRYNPLFGPIEKLEAAQEFRLPERTASQPALLPGPTREVLAEEYTRRDVLMFSVIDYDFRFQRPQHFADGFAAQGHRVFYFNANFSDGTELRVEKRKQNLFLITLPNRSHDAVYSTAFRDDGSDVCPLLDAFMDEYAVRDAMIVCGYPTWNHPVRYLQTKYGFSLVTDYMDDFSGFDNVEKSFVERECISLLEHSDLVIASSTYLSDRASRYNANVAVIRNGTQYTHFHRAFRERSENRRKVIGYYGAIAHWFDFAKIQRLSKDYPQAEIVLIGAVTSGEELLRTLPNVRLVGEVDYAELPEYLADFDVCLIPFETSTDLIRATNPVKFYEYLSAGKKVVATGIPELEPYRDKFVYLADDEEQFSDYVGLCLRGEDTLADSQRAMEFARKNDWAVRIHDFLSLTDRLFPCISIIVLCYNQLDYTKKCVDSIRRFTAWPNYELVLVDNASSDGTAEWIRELSREDKRIVPVINKTNRGFAGGNNDGIRASSGEYLVLLNNDTLVTRGWLTGLVKHSRRNADRCIVGPVTNSIGNEAMIRLNYTRVEDMPAAAFAYTSAHMGQTYPHVDVLAMFCVLFSRELTQTIGLLDENYGTGMFEDDDYSAAALHAGYGLVLAEDVFIHHFGSVSFSKLTDEAHRELFERNRAYYEKKWNTAWKMHQYRPGLTTQEP